MKKITFLIAMSFFAGLMNSSAQNSWLQKADFGGGGISESAGFSIGKKGYIGTGYNYLTGGFRSDFWEYNPDNNAWTQKADFGGGPRSRVTGIAIGDKGYMGLGFSDIPPNIWNDFWEYNPANNTWTQKANFGGGARLFAVGFAIGNKGYIGTGFYYHDFWEYDPASDNWTQKADFAGGGRTNAVGFSIGSKGYMGTGFTDANVMVGDFWEYDSESDTWTQKANFEPGPRFGAVGFSIGSKGYVGSGESGTYSVENDFWEYNPETNKWTKKADFPGGNTIYAAGFSLGNKGYLGTGSGDNGYLSTFWEYTPEELTCDIPVNLTSSNITATSAKLKWDAVNGAEGYQVAYKAASATQWTMVHSFTNVKKITGLTESTKYAWRVKTICSVSPLVTSASSDQAKFITAPLRTTDESLQTNALTLYPNPAKEQTSVSFFLPQSSHVMMKMYDVSGKEIATLLDGDLAEGNHSMQLDITDFSKGIYVVRMFSDEGIQNQKLVVE